MKRIDRLARGRKAIKASTAEPAWRISGILLLGILILILGLVGCSAQKGAVSPEAVKVDIPAEVRGEVSAFQWMPKWFENALKQFDISTKKILSENSTKLLSDWKIESDNREQHLEKSIGELKTSIATTNTGTFSGGAWAMVVAWVATVGIAALIYLRLRTWKRVAGAIVDGLERAGKSDPDHITAIKGDIQYETEKVGVGPEVHNLVRKRTGI